MMLIIADNKANAIAAYKQATWSMPDECCLHIEEAKVAVTEAAINRSISGNW